MPDEIIRLDALSKHHARDGEPFTALSHASLKIFAGETVAVCGGSGSGKSTLLQLVGLLDLPDSGRYFFAGQDTSALSHDQWAEIRNRKLGFIFQSFNLLSYLNVLDNVALPLTYRGVRGAIARDRAQALLARVGLGERGQSYPADLSGGQRQRVAIARALVGNPALLLADEPTGNLDPITAEQILDLLLSFNREWGTTLILVTHDERMAQRMGRRFDVSQGHVREWPSAPLEHVDAR